MIRKTLFRLGAGACALLAAGTAQAQDFYLGQILTVGFAYCPDGTVDANGQELSTSTYMGLFALYGVTYGGNGSSTFRVPDLRGRVQIGQGSGPSLTPMTQGGVGGSESVSLSSGQLPAHTHVANMRATTSAPSSHDPSGKSLATFAGGSSIYGTGTPTVDMAGGTVAVGVAGSSSPVALRDPYLVLRYCVVVSGTWPPMP